MKDLTDFAVLCKGVTIPPTKDNLRVIPLSEAPSLSYAIKGLSQGSEGSIVPADIDKNMPKNEAGAFIDNVVKVQHKSDGYCRIVAKLTNNTSSAEVDGVVEYARGFILIQKDEKDTWKPIAVASLHAGIDLNQPEIYVAFTFSKTNNYQSVSFSPNAFATIEDINEINGLDGLHIAFDHTSGDIKLLDGEGNVLDQANLHMDADTIIADGEEGYKYVKTDRQQDIHAEKDFMPAGKTAHTSVAAQAYVPTHACFVVDVSNDKSVQDAKQAVIEAGEDAVALALANAQLAKAQMEAAKSLVEQGHINGIRVYSGDSNVAYEIGGRYRNAVKGIDNLPLLQATEKEISGVEVYSPDAFVWTVGNAPDIVKEGDEDASGNVGKVRVVEGDTTTYRDLTFAEQMNVNAQALGFHIGDDIPLGTNIATLIVNMSAKDGFDAEKYMHEGTDSDYIDERVDAQRNLAKEELKAWNAQHPGLVKDVLNGTRISSDGVDIRNGKIEIGNGVANATDEQHKEDNVKRYVIETDIDVVGDVARVDTGLQIGVIDSIGGETGDKPIQKDILTINAEDYISGAPTCLALLKCHKDSKGLTADLTETTGEPDKEVTVNVGRITANFTAEGTEDASNGVFTLTITDNRANNGFGSAHRIVEIIPVYKSGADDTEAVPAQRSISAIALAETNNDGKSTLSIQCSQVIDWAQSIDLGGTVSTTQDDPDAQEVPSEPGIYVKPNGMELYLIVKVY